MKVTGRAACLTMGLVALGLFAASGAAWANLRSRLSVGIWQPGHRSNGSTPNLASNQAAIYLAADAAAGNGAGGAAATAGARPGPGAGGAMAAATPAAKPASRGRRIFFVGISAIGLLALAAVLLAGQLRLLIVGEDNRYSNSKFQMALWFGVLIVSYIATLLLRWREGGGAFIGGVNIPVNLLALSGLSALTLGAAKGITTNKQAAAPQAGVAAKTFAPAPRFPYDLLHNDNGRPDFGDFQMLVITLVAASVYLLQVFHFLGTDLLTSPMMLPDVDTTILAAFGLGQGAYLTKKYAGNPGEA